MLSELKEQVEAKNPHLPIILRHCPKHHFPLSAFQLEEEGIVAIDITLFYEGVLLQTLNVSEKYDFLLRVGLSAVLEEALFEIQEKVPELKFILIDQGCFSRLFLHVALDQSRA